MLNQTNNYYLGGTSLEFFMNQLYQRKFKNMGLSHEDFTSAFKTKLESLDSEVVEPLAARVSALENLIEADSDAAINKFNEIVSFLEGLDPSNPLSGIIENFNTKTTELQDQMDTIKTAQDKDQADISDLKSRLQGELKGNVYIRRAADDQSDQITLHGKYGVELHPKTTSDKVTHNNSTVKAKLEDVEGRWDGLEIAIQEENFRFYNKDGDGEQRYPETKAEFVEFKRGAITNVEQFLDLLNGNIERTTRDLEYTELKSSVVPLLEGMITSETLSRYFGDSLNPFYKTNLSIWVGAPYAYETTYISEGNCWCIPLPNNCTHVIIRVNDNLIKVDSEGGISKHRGKLTYRFDNVERDTAGGVHDANDRYKLINLVFSGGAILNNPYQGESGFLYLNQSIYQASDGNRASLLPTDITIFILGKERDLDVEFRDIQNKLGDYHLEPNPNVTTGVNIMVDDEVQSVASSDEVISTHLVNTPGGNTLDKVLDHIIGKVDGVSTQLGEFSLVDTSIEDPGDNDVEQINIMDDAGVTWPVKTYARAVEVREIVDGVSCGKTLQEYLDTHIGKFYNALTADEPKDNEDWTNNNLFQIKGSHPDDKEGNIYPLAEIIDTFGAEIYDVLTKARSVLFPANKEHGYSGELKPIDEVIYGIQDDFENYRNYLETLDANLMDSGVSILNSRISKLIYLSINDTYDNVIKEADKLIEQYGVNSNINREGIILPNTNPSGTFKGVIKSFEHYPITAINTYTPNKTPYQVLIAPFIYNTLSPYNRDVPMKIWKDSMALSLSMYMEFYLPKQSSIGFSDLGGMASNMNLQLDAYSWLKLWHRECYNESDADGNIIRDFRELVLNLETMSTIELSKFIINIGDNLPSSDLPVPVTYRILSDGLTNLTLTGIIEDYRDICNPVLYINAKELVMVNLEDFVINPVSSGSRPYPIRFGFRYWPSAEVQSVEEELPNLEAVYVKMGYKENDFDLDLSRCPNITVECLERILSQANDRTQEDWWDTSKYLKLIIHQNTMELIIAASKENIIEDKFPDKGIQVFIYEPGEFYLKDMFGSTVADSSVPSDVFTI